MKKNKKIFIILSVIVIVLFATGIFAYLYLKTDMFKSEQQLFAKYITQSVEKIKENIDLQAIEAYKGLENKSKYESTTNIKIINSEGGEISNPLNKLTAKLDIQEDKENEYLYGNGQILFDGEKYLQAEIIKDKKMYGVRFSDVVKQFVTIKNDENLEKVANNLGVEFADLEEIFNFVNSNDELITQDIETTISTEYSNIIMQEIQKGAFTKQKNAMITHNNMTVKTNAYELNLNEEQVKSLLISILNNLKNDTEMVQKLPVVSEDDIIETIEQNIEDIENSDEIPSAKITVYEQKQEVIRTIIEIGQFKVTIDNLNENEIVKSKIHLVELNSDEVIEYNIEISKSKVEGKEKFEIVISSVEDEDSNKISFIAETSMSEKTNELNIQLKYEQDIILVALEISNVTNVGEEFDKLQIIDTNENMLLNDLDEIKMKYVIDFLKEKVPEKTGERVGELIMKVMGLEDESTEETGNEVQENSQNNISQEEINRFNAKFEFYTGDEVSAENVKKLLDVVRNNVNGHTIMSSGEEDNSKVNIILNIEKDKTNEESITKTLEKIEDNKKYKVSITYSDNNNLIEKITIIEN